MMTRRLFFILALICFSTPVFAGDHPSIAFTKRLAKDMLAAHRMGTVGKFAGVILTYADVPEISTYCLGQYKDKLQASDRQAYYRGVVNFMARYFSQQSQNIVIAKYEVGEAKDDDADVVVPIRVYLTTGQSYNVQWRLHWASGRYKVTDVKILGFSLTYMQRGIFSSFLAKRNGDVSQLVAVLNR